LELLSFLPGDRLDSLTVDIDNDLAVQLSAIRDDMADEYFQPHGHPWIVGYSGGDLSP
jgi:hypothetical protein